MLLFYCFCVEVALQKHSLGTIDYITNYIQSSHLTLLCALIALMGGLFSLFSFLAYWGVEWYSVSDPFSPRAQPGKK